MVFLGVGLPWSTTWSAQEGHCAVFSYPRLVWGRKTPSHQLSWEFTASGSLGSAAEVGQCSAGTETQGPQHCLPGAGVGGTTHGLASLRPALVPGSLAPCVNSIVSCRQAVSCLLRSERLMHHRCLICVTNILLSFIHTLYFCSRTLSDNRAKRLVFLVPKWQDQDDQGP